MTEANIYKTTSEYLAEVVSFSGPIVLDPVPEGRIDGASPLVQVASSDPVAFVIERYQKPIMLPKCYFAKHHQFGNHLTQGFRPSALIRIDGGILAVLYSDGKLQVEVPLLTSTNSEIVKEMVKKKGASYHLTLAQRKYLKL